MAWLAWRQSHHLWAWREPDETAVLGDFDDARSEHGGNGTRFFRRDGRFYVRTEGPDGNLSDFQVAFTVGVDPLQQYLVEIERGRLQALDLAWDVEGQRWFRLNQEQVPRAGEGLHWTGPYMNWNGRCAECHATGYVKNYDPKSRRYSSTQAEIGVGCEACHGPGEAHLTWARTPQAFAARPRSRLTDRGLVVRYSADAPTVEIEQCAGCHARREPLLGGSPLPGTPFHDSYRLALLREGLYHADGSIEDEVYVYGSFLQSRMYARGVRCSDCHEPHSAKLKVEGSGVCTQCHSAAGNARFPSLKKAVYDAASHHFHVLGSPAAECKSCHMIERVYMGVDGRRDHGFRIPRPSLSVSTGVPNACSDCHTDKSFAWAAEEIANRFGSSTQAARMDFAETFARARRNPGHYVDDLLGIAARRQEAGIVRASALDLLSFASDEAVARRATLLLEDPDPLVRAAAVAVQRGATPAERVRRVGHLLGDPLRSVRIAAARGSFDGLLTVRRDSRHPAADAALAEWRESLLNMADFPESQMALGGVALALRRPGAAEAAFREAVRLDPQATAAWITIARIRLALGDPDGAALALDQGLEKNPNNGMIEALKRDLIAAPRR